MNVLIIEVKAESFFAFCQTVMRDPANFTDRHPAALHAAELVERIRTDEAIHVAYLQMALSELRSFTVKTVDGKTVPGLRDHRQGLVRHDRSGTRSRIRTSRGTRRATAILARLKSKPNGAVLASQFDSLEFKAAAE